MKKKAGYYKICSRVRENCFYDLDKFSNLIVRSDVDDFLHICSAERLHLDIFLNKPAYFQYPDYDFINGKCCHFEVFSFARDLFGAFSAVFVRMYLNYTINHFSDLISQLSLADERKLFKKFFWFALNLLHEFLDIDYLFFYEFFNVFEEVYFSQCYVVSSKKTKFGSYGPPTCSLEVIMF